MKIAYLAHVAVAAAAITTSVSAQSTLDFPQGENHPYRHDSGVLANPTDAFKVVHKDVVFVNEAAWLRLFFDLTIRLEADSYLRVTSILDGEVQELDAGDLSMWTLSTAYFNGNMLLVELVAAPGTTENRLVIDEVQYAVGVALPTGSCGICGADNRTPSDQDFACRLWPVGCSAAVYSEQSCLVSAGHCMQSGNVAQFRVPDSSSNCNVNHPPVSDQFPITDYSGVNGGVGNDWAVCTTGTNNLGETAYERYGELRPITASNPGSGQSIDIWGYGIDSQCTRNQIQQHSTGSITSVFGSYLEHNADATFGNSGSSIIRNGEILGIVTHCPCPNVATRIDHAAFVAARAALCLPPTATGACCLGDGSCTEGFESQCNLQGGVYQGDDTECPGTCNEFGACCLEDGQCFEVTAIICDTISGEYTAGADCSPNPCPGADCPADLDGDLDVGFADLLALLAAWGPCGGCPADLDLDGSVGFADLLALLAAWGPCL